MRYVVDTHALIWYLSGDSRLGEKAHEVLADPSSQLLIPTLVLAEAKHLSERKRVSITFDAIMRTIATASRITILPLDIFTVASLPPNFDIHDGLIVASARVARELFAEEVSILTRDEEISASGLLPVVW
jgi:PIN domain nuclease of toxin-antitoxin system